MSKARSDVCYSTRAFRLLLKDLKFLLELDCQATRLPYLVAIPFIGFIFNQTRYVYQIWFESKLVNAVFRRLSNVKYGAAACSRCSTRVHCTKTTLRSQRRGKITTLHLEMKTYNVHNCQLSGAVINRHKSK